MKTNPLLVQVTSRGQVIGHVTTKEFREYAGIYNAFTAEVVKRFNEMKERRGEPERAKLVLKKEAA